MSKKALANDKETKEHIAAQLVAASEGLISVPKAMKTAGFPTPDRKNSSIIKRVHRKSKSQKSRASDATSKSDAADLVDLTTIAAPADGQSGSSLSEPASGPSRATTNSLSIDDVNSVKRALGTPNNTVLVKRWRASK